MSDWISFWDTAHSIYVNARHRDVHYRTIAEDVRQLIPAPDATVMDYGCGEALHAGRIAQAAGQLTLVEAAPGVVAGLRQRFVAETRIEIRTPPELAALPNRSYDLILLHSVAQYLSRPALAALLSEFRRLLKPEGRLIVGDVIPRHLTPFADAIALLRFAAAHGFLIAAVMGLARTLGSDYVRLRRRLGLSCYEEEEFIALLAAHGFAARRAARNIGHNQARMAFEARPA